MERPAPIDPETYASIVRDASDEEIAAGMEANRDLILTEIFRAMPERFDSDRAGELECVLEWRITDRPGGGCDRWQVAIADRACSAERDGNAEPTATITIDPVDLVKLVAGIASPPRLFVTGKLRLEGNLLKAAQTARVFRIPAAG